MTDGALTHWTQFDQLYDLPDPRPYFRGVATGDYRMPGLLAGVLEQLIPIAAARPDRLPGPVRLVDFACGYGAVGLCLRTGATMADLTKRYQGDDGRLADIGYFADRRRDVLPTHLIDGIDIAGSAVDYAKQVGALDNGFAENLLDGSPSAALLESVRTADIIFECGAIGDFLAAAMDGVTKIADVSPRPWLVLCPRPRVDMRTVNDALMRNGYIVETILPGLKYRKAFSDGERAEEIASGLENGLTAEDCMVGEYFRVDLRLAVPQGSNASRNVERVRAAVAEIDPDAY